ncbi:alpha- -sialyltransferase 8f-like isoform x1 [Limosa lapponica baueri]|uniref:Alpha--sialyltransferase 8f-like isoform x1 n=1 Tax=Limosa lapponica baueri TaxID=1758121 RepID=A0A2I0TA21_LIMLA|nr:alpha- -sialyltransferase 8f-like isoform x1 [Limosa lapponica baueri]
MKDVWRWMKKVHDMAELGRCCNASAWLPVTRDNTPLGSKIVYDGYRSKSFKVSSGLLEILPRFNLPFVDFPEDVGRKSSIVTVNPSILQERFRGLNGRRLPFVEAAASYGKTWFFIPAFSYPGNSEASYQALYALQDSASQSRVFFFHPQYLSALSKYWQERGFRTCRLSSGFMLVSAALELCHRVTLYGFWPFPLHPDGHPLPHHYYDNVLPKPRIHSMAEEFTYYVGLHFGGVLRLQLGRCRGGGQR